jgi:hypothetical protein
VSFSGWTEPEKRAQPSWHRNRKILWVGLKKRLLYVALKIRSPVDFISDFESC